MSMTVIQAISSAATAKSEGLLGEYPMAAQLLADEVTRLRASIGAIHFRLKFGGWSDDITAHIIIQECEQAIPELSAIAI